MTNREASYKHNRTLELDRWLKVKDNKNKINLNQCPRCMARSRKDHGKEIDQAREPDQERALEQAQGLVLGLEEGLALIQGVDLTLE